MCHVPPAHVLRAPCCSCECSVVVSRYASDGFELRQSNVVACSCASLYGMCTEVQRRCPLKYARLQPITTTFNTSDPHTIHKHCTATQRTRTRTHDARLLVIYSYFIACLQLHCTYLKPVANTTHIFPHPPDARLIRCSTIYIISLLT